MPTVSIITDTIYTYRFIKLLVTPFEETKAYQLGLIDSNGERTKKKIENSTQRAALTPFHKLVFSIRKLMAVAPGGKSKLASYAAAWYLVKDNFKLKEENIQKILKKTGYDSIMSLAEDTEWNKNPSGQLRKGNYRTTNERLDNDKFYIIPTNSKVRVSENAEPVGSIFGISIYEVVHVNSNKKLYVTSGELLKC